MSRPFDVGEPGTRCLIIHPQISGRGTESRSAQSHLGEATGLARAIDLRVAHAESVNVNKPRPATFLGQGTVDRIGETAEQLRDQEPGALIIVMDCALTPVQQRNLEQAWDSKVIDRTGLILEIFGARARTREGRLQVELAALTYQRSRLVRSWTHLERQRGGSGFTGGPGERQIELDRRMIDQRIDRIKRDLKDVERTRALHRKARKKVPYPIIALVGYTNAGKSTLFNRLTDANVAAEDQLFATLDPTMRAIQLPSGRQAVLSDTVGFVSSLPHELVNAFHATLEEVSEADLIVHVRDISHPESQAQKRDVLGVLGEIGIDDAAQNEMIEALNKIDLVDADAHDAITARSDRQNERVVAISAETGEGCKALLTAMSDHLSAGYQLIEVNVDPTDGRKLAWLYQHGEVVERTDTDERILVTVRLSPIEAARFEQQSQ